MAERWSYLTQNLYQHPGFGRRVCFTFLLWHRFSAWLCVKSLEHLGHLALQIKDPKTTVYPNSQMSSNRVKIFEIKGVISPRKLQVAQTCSSAMMSHTHTPVWWERAGLPLTQSHVTSWTSIKVPESHRSLTVNLLRLPCICKFTSRQTLANNQGLLFVC